MNKPLHHKVVIITGGSSGIGKACAETYGLAGARIVITGRNAAKLEQAAIELRAQGIDVLPIVADAASETDNQQMATQALQHFGRIDILIANAGMSMRALFAEADLSVIKTLMDINFYGAVYATKYCLPELLRNSGSVVAVSSIAGKRGLPARTGYSASKFAMQGFYEALRCELRGTGVHVLMVCPGFTASNIRQTALGKDGYPQQESPRDESSMMSAQAVAQAMLRATLRRRRDLVLTPVGLFTVIANKFFPAWMDKLVYNHLKKEKDSPLLA